MTDLDHRDVDIIRPPHPGQTRIALAVLAIIAAGSFVSGLGRQIVGPLLSAPPAEDPAHAAIAPAQPLPPAAQPAVQVAATEPVRPSPPKLDVPDPEPATPAIPELAAVPAPAPAPAAAATVEAAAPPAADTADTAAAAPAEPPTDLAEPPIG